MVVEGSPVNLLALEMHEASGWAWSFHVSLLFTVPQTTSNYPLPSVSLKSSSDMVTNRKES